MKGIFKLMTAAVAVGTLASCSDELDVQKAAVQARQQADLIGTLSTGANTRIGIEETDWDNGRLADFELRWTEGDQVRVFKLDNMTYNTYELDPATAGTSTGAFTKKNDFLTDLTGKMYAMTEGQFVYAISPNAEGKPLLTMSIPNSYDLDEEYLELTGVNKFPAPYWGETTTVETGTDTDGNPTYQVTAPFKGLTSFLRLDLRTLPVGTKAIVLTTHGSRTSHMPNISGSEAEGFQLATKAQMVASGYATAADKLITRDNYLLWYNRGQNFVTGGQSEPLSGTLSCVLEDGAALAYSDKLVSRDTIRINLENIPEVVGTGITDFGTGEELTTVENEDKVIYVPIVAGLYKDLHVIAVTEDSPFSYQWVGEEIEKYTDEVFKANTIKQLIMKLDVDMTGVTTWSGLSEAIYEASLENPGRMLNVDIPAAVMTDAPAVLYVDNTQTHNDLVLNWPAGADVNERLQIVEAVPEYDAAREVVKRWLGVAEDPASAERYITLNLDNACAKEYNFSTPTSIVTIGTTNGFNNQNATVKVIAAAKNEMVPSSTINDPTIYPGVSGHDLVESGGSELMNRKNATVFVKNGIGALEIMPTSVGAVYIYSGGFEETEIYNYYAIRSDKAILTRLTDALVYNVWPLETENTKRYLFTTGSSAIGMIKPLASANAAIQVVNPYEKASENLTAGEVKDGDKPSNFHVVAYWTGAALQPAAIARYDKAFVYTAAQLASAGEETTSDYAIPAGVVTEMWLGANYFPWIGAEADVADFKFNGMNVSLQNMELEIGDASFTDPHHCCTSCGELRKINLTENLGLFRSIVAATAAKVENINLNDVLLTTEEPIDNIGAIAGLIQTPSATLNNNQVGEVKIDVNGTNIGGMVGLLQGDNTVLTMNNNKVTNKDDDKTVGYIISDKDNVGGQIGHAIVQNANIQNSSVSLKDQITAGSRNIGTKKEPVLVSRVGGIVGLMEQDGTNGYVYITNPNVYVKNQILGAEQQVGGIGGYIDAEGQAKITEGKVETALIESENGGFVGGAAGQLDNGFARVTKNEVKATQILADDDNVGGVVGRLNDSKNNADFSGNKVTSDKIYTPAQNAGGLIGFSNMPLANAYMDIQSADITVKELEATDGFAGGEIGSQHKGTVKIGKCVAAVGEKLDNKVAINKISGKFALGGLVGGNNDKTYVYSNHKGTETAKTGYSMITLNVGDWSNTFATEAETNAYFNADNETDHRSGTVGNVVGYLDGALYVQEVKTDITVTDKLTSAKKHELGFYNHKNRKYTIDEYAYYWGDTNGYVGWGHSGVYNISTDNTATPSFNASNADQTGNWNLYKPESVYDTTKSKWE